MVPGDGAHCSFGLLDCVGGDVREDWSVSFISLRQFHGMSSNPCSHDHY